VVKFYNREGKVVEGKENLGCTEFMITGEQKVSDKI
jgi:hypothetical protein